MNEQENDEELEGIIYKDKSRLKPYLPSGIFENSHTEKKGRRQQGESEGKNSHNNKTQIREEMGDHHEGNPSEKNKGKGGGNPYGQVIPAKHSPRLSKNFPFGPINEEKPAVIEGEQAKKKPETTHELASSGEEMDPHSRTLQQIRQWNKEMQTQKRYTPAQTAETTNMAVELEIRMNSCISTIMEIEGTMDRPNLKKECEDTLKKIRKEGEALLNGIMMDAVARNMQNTAAGRINEHRGQTEKNYISRLQTGTHKEESYNGTSSSATYKAPEEWTCIEDIENIHIGRAQKEEIQGDHPWGWTEEQHHGNSTCGLECKCCQALEGIIEEACPTCVRWNNSKDSIKNYEEEKEVWAAPTQTWLEAKKRANKRKKDNNDSREEEASSSDRNPNKESESVLVILKNFLQEKKKGNKDRDTKPKDEGINQEKTNDCIQDPEEKSPCEDAKKAHVFQEEKN